jgi:hypothetical protein
MNINIDQAQQNEPTSPALDELRHKEWAHALAATLKKRFGKDRITVEEFLSIFWDEDDAEDGKDALG